MCKSSEICAKKKTGNMVFKVFFEQTNHTWFFSLFVAYIREICGCVHRMVYWQVCSKKTFKTIFPGFFADFTEFAHT